MSLEPKRNVYREGGGIEIQHVENNLNKLQERQEESIGRGDVSLQLLSSRADEIFRKNGIKRSGNTYGSDRYHDGDTHIDIMDYIDRYNQHSEGDEELGVNSLNIIMGVIKDKLILDTDKKILLYGLSLIIKHLQTQDRIKINKESGENVYKNFLICLRSIYGDKCPKNNKQAYNRGIQTLYYDYEQIWFEKKIRHDTKTELVVSRPQLVELETNDYLEKLHTLTKKLLGYSTDGPLDNIIKLPSKEFIMLIEGIVMNESGNTERFEKILSEQFADDLDLFLCNLAGSQINSQGMEDNLRHKFWPLIGPIVQKKSTQIQMHYLRIHLQR